MRLAPRISTRWCTSLGRCRKQVLSGGSGDSSARGAMTQPQSWRDQGPTHPEVAQRPFSSA